MTKPCSICSHPKRTEIETELTNGTPYRDIEKWYNVGRSAISRHKREGHLNPELIKSLPPEVIAEDATLQQQLRGLHARTLTLLTKAEGSGDGRMALAAIRECRENIQTLARIELVLMERAGGDREHHVTIVYDHEDTTPPPGSSLGVSLNQPDDIRNLARGLPDEDVEAQAIRILEKRGYVVGRAENVFIYPDDAGLSDHLVSELDRISKQYIEQIERGQKVDLNGTSVAQRVGYLIALASGTRMILPSDGRNKSESVEAVSQNQTFTTK